MNPAPRTAHRRQPTGIAGGSPAATDGNALRAPAGRSGERVLSDEMLARFASRAAVYDRENRFFDEDFIELRAARYLLLAVPAELGGAGMSLAQVCREQRRPAHHAPPTPPAGEKHLFWAGGAPRLLRAGASRPGWVARAGGRR